VTSQRIRFVIEAIAIVAVAAGVGFAHLGQNAVLGAVMAVWGAAALVEYRISRR
jgi:hypothetical protein